ncbi:hypothetical protein TNCV_3797861 [Trichonephila clavipes]|nr:hypothetical protein TNCV_3797861 [Trichonephila clavipes]
MVLAQKSVTASPSAQNHGREKKSPPHFLSSLAARTTDESQKRSKYCGYEEDVADHDSDPSFVTLTSNAAAPRPPFHLPHELACPLDPPSLP